MVQRISDTLLNLSNNDILKTSVLGQNVVGKALEFLAYSTNSECADSLVSLLTNLASDDLLR